jgi:hypothetical protein
LSAIEQNFPDTSFIIAASVFIDEWVFGSFKPFRVTRATLVEAGPALPFIEAEEII